MLEPRKRSILLQSLQLVALIAITFAAYFPVLRNGFIWDDDRYIEQNSHLHSVRGLEQIWLQPLKAEPQYYPLTHTTLWVEYHLWGLHAVGYHVDNLLLHAASAAMLWRILRRLKIPGAWLAAMIFAVHPLQVESVAWATERKNCLSGLLYLLSLWAYLQTRWGRRIWDGDENGESGMGWYFVSLLLFVGALLSKSVASSMPVAILILVWWKRGKIRLKDFYPVTPMLIAGAAMGCLTGWMEKHVVGAIGPDFDFLTPLDRVCIAGRAFWFYLGKLLCPVRLTFIYPHWNVDPAQRLWWILFPVLAIAFLVSCWGLRNRVGRGPLTAMLFFAVTLAPALGFVNVFPMRFSYVADHFQYFACIGPIVLLVAMGMRIATSDRYVSGVLLVVIAGLGVLSNVRSRVYLDRRTLWSDTLAKNPDSPMAHNNLAVELMHAGDLDAAEAQFREAARLRTDASDWVGVGQCAAIAGDYPRALEMYLKALDSTRVSNEPVFQRLRAGREFQVGTAYQSLAGEFPARAAEYFSQAEQAYLSAIELYPEYEDPRTNLASILVTERRYAEAIQQCQAVLEENPESFSARMNMGNAYYARGELDLALPQYRQALALEPDNANAMASIGAILAQQGQVDQGIAMLREALKIDPNNPLSQQDLLAALSKASQSKP